MSYQSIDTLQKSLANSIFSSKTDAKKAAGRALGTIVEIITYYLLNEWGLGGSTRIETKLPEYGNPEITHNVEFTLHKLQHSTGPAVIHAKPITSTKLLKYLSDTSLTPKTGTLLSSDGIVKNSCIIGESEEHIALANLNENIPYISVVKRTPFAMFECKRVGVEEGQKKGPQTIEKAKQGAYVAIKSSALQKITNEKGELIGIYFSDGNPVIGQYETLLDTLISSGNTDNILLTFGIISNHGNWFTSDDMNKELKVLANAFDRILFLSDAGLSQFIDETILNPDKKYSAIQKAFNASYSEGKKSNVFTKSKMDIDAHNALRMYFHENISRIEEWFNILTPATMSMAQIKQQLIELADSRI